MSKPTRPRSKPASETKPPVGRPVSPVHGRATPAQRGARSAVPAVAASAATRPASGPRYWLLKSEPTSFSFAALERCPGRRSSWDGVRNYQARNFLRDSMRLGDLILFYHSNAAPAGVAGVARVASPAVPDPTQFDPRDEHFDPKADRAAPPWVQVDVEALVPLPRFVPLEALKGDPRLARMMVVQRGSRLSVQPVQPGEWRAVLALGGLDPDEF